MCVRSLAWLHPYPVSRNDLEQVFWRRLLKPGHIYSDFSLVNPPRNLESLWAGGCTWMTVFNSPEGHALHEFLWFFSDSVLSAGPVSPGDEFLRPATRCVKKRCSSSASEQLPDNFTIKHALRFCQIYRPWKWNCVVCAQASQNGVHGLGTR